MGFAESLGSLAPGGPLLRNLFFPKLPEGSRRVKGPPESRSQAAHLVGLSLNPSSACGRLQALDRNVPFCPCRREEPKQAPLHLLAQPEIWLSTIKGELLTRGILTFVKELDRKIIN